MQSLSSMITTLISSFHFKTVITIIPDRNIKQRPKLLKLLSWQSHASQQFSFVSRKKNPLKNRTNIKLFPTVPGAIVLRHLVTPQKIKHSLIYSQHVLQVQCIRFDFFSIFQPEMVLFQSFDLLFFDWRKKIKNIYWFYVFLPNLHTVKNINFKINIGKLYLKTQNTHDTKYRHPKNRLTAGKGTESDNSACLLLPSPLWKHTLKSPLIKSTHMQKTSVMSQPILLK